MSYALVLSRDAALDIEEARLSLRQPGAGCRAEERLQQIRKVSRDLRNGPARWPIGHHPGIREASAGGYRNLYQFELSIGHDNAAGIVMALRVSGPGQDRTNLPR